MTLAVQTALPNKPDPMQPIRASADRVMLIIIGVHLLYCLALAPWYDTYVAFFAVGLPAGLVAMLLAWRMPGQVITRMVVAVVFMVLTALAVHQARGMIEMHFGFFVLFAVLLFYRDWKVYLAATLVAALHHVSFNYLQQINYGVFCFTQTGWDVVAIHVGYVLFAFTVLVYLSEVMHRSALSAYTTLSASETANRGLTQLTDSVRSAVGEIGASVQQVIQGNHALSQRATQQAGTLQETASSMGQLTATVKQNAHDAGEANDLVTGASQVAVKGGQVVGDVVLTMNGISESSRKIADIIGVIDGIAFQTNILALNAAVEAARAGEQGRGFAVVASEVRALAQRSASAAKEIKALIGDSVAKVDAGGKQVEQAGKTMQEIVDSVTRVNQIMTRITVASQEQSAGIEQVNQAVMHLEQSTQQNAAVMDRASVAAETMRQHAAHLLQTVSRVGAQDSAAPSLATPPASIARAAPAVSSTRARTAITSPPAARRLQQPARTTDDGEWKEF